MGVTCQHPGVVHQQVFFLVGPLKSALFFQQPQLLKRGEISVEPVTAFVSLLHMLGM
jgi:hypothetical protein